VIISRKPPTEVGFEFELTEPGSVLAGDYVEVPLELGTLVARVTRVMVENSYLSTPGLVREHVRFGLKLPSLASLESCEVHVARAESVGIVGVDGRLMPPCAPPPPGSPVYRASAEALSRVLGFSSEGIRIGRVWRLGVEAVLDPDKLFRHHVAVLGSTGSGKSYTCGVLAEEALEMGLPVIILDFHGEYTTLGERYRARVVRVDEVGLEPGFVSPDAIAEATEMSDIQRDLLFLAAEEAAGPTLADLEEAVPRIAERYGFRRETLIAVLRRLKTLRAMGVFTGKGELPTVSEGECLIIDVGVGMPAPVTRGMAGSVVWWLFEERRGGSIPPFLLIIDEAHKLLPVEEASFCRTAVRMVAREGRKFGACLVVASQRVVGLDKDVLSQCGTKFVLRMDSPTDLAMLRPLLGRHTKLLPYLPTGVALVTGVAVQHPTLIEVRRRKTRHGGEPATLALKRA
ncbi:MAG: hypothetical protein DRK00_09375, partial [Thermoprotei archaeon]